MSKVQQLCALFCKPGSIVMVCGHAIQLVKMLLDIKTNGFLGGLLLSSDTHTKNF